MQRRPAGEAPGERIEDAARMTPLDVDRTNRTAQPIGADHVRVGAARVKTDRIRRQSVEIRRQLIADELQRQVAAIAAVSHTLRRVRNDQCHPVVENCHKYSNDNYYDILDKF